MSFPRKFILVFAILASFVGLYDVVNGIGSPHGVSSAAAASNISTSSNSLQGEYHQVQSGLPKAVMAATISDNKIEITLTMQDTTGLFWEGTFDTNSVTSQPFKMTSYGDLKLLDASLYGSSEKTKEFFYDYGDLSFQFSIMGVSTTVHLSK